MVGRDRARPSESAPSRMPSHGRLASSLRPRPGVPGAHRSRGVPRPGPRGRPASAPHVAVSGRRRAAARAPRRRLPSRSRRPSPDLRRLRSAVSPGRRRALMAEGVGSRAHRRSGSFHGKHELLGGRRGDRATGAAAVATMQSSGWPRWLSNGRIGSRDMAASTSASRRVGSSTRKRRPGGPWPERPGVDAGQLRGSRTALVITRIRLHRDPVRASRRPTHRAVRVGDGAATFLPIDAPTRA